MRNSQSINLLFLSFFALMLFSCSKSVKDPNPQDDNAQKVYKYIKSLGYPESSIVDKGNNFVVEGDISFPKKMTVPPDAGRTGATEQYHNGTLVNIANSVVGIRVHSSASAQAAEVNAAVALWNNANAYITLQVVTGGEDILLQNTNLGTGVCGQGQFPSGGAPGSVIDINISEVAGHSFNQRMINIAHEIGHCIGFRHTNGDGGVFGTAVPGWGGTDANSIMNGGMCGSLPTVLSSKDINSVNTLYRNPFPSNAWIDLSYNTFTIRWTSAPPIYNDTFLHYLVEYGGQSGTGFSGSVTIPVSGANSYVIPGAVPDPNPPSQMGYIHATVKAVYSSATCASPTVSKYKSNGVWN